MFYFCQNKFVRLKLNFFNADADVDADAKMLIPRFPNGPVMHRLSVSICITQM